MTEEEWGNPTKQRVPADSRHREGLLARASVPLAVAYGSPVHDQWPVDSGRGPRALTGEALRPYLPVLVEAPRVPVDVLPPQAPVGEHRG